MVNVSTPTKWVLRVLALGYVFLLVAWPVAKVVTQTFAGGLDTLAETLSDPQVVGALKLSAAGRALGRGHQPGLRRHDLAAARAL